MKRWVWFAICLLLGLVMLVCGWLMPVYLRAVDAAVLQRAGADTPGLVQRGLSLVSEEQWGAAQLLLQAAEADKLPGRGRLALAARNLAAQHPNWQVWGAPEPALESRFSIAGQLPASGLEPFTDLIVPEANRERALSFLEASAQPAVQELLRSRTLTRTVIFAPSQAPGGQAFDTAVSVCGLLLAQGKLTPDLSNTIYAAAANANRTGNSRPLEQVLLDLMSLGQRFNWSQLAAFVGHIQDAETLRLQTDWVRKAGRHLPALFSAVELSGEPAAAAKYLTDYSRTGLDDLGASLRFGAGGVKEILARDQQFYSSPLRQFAAEYDPFGAFFYFTLDYCWRTPVFALIMKWFFYLAGGFLLAAALHFARPKVSTLEEPLQVRGFHVAREFLFALGFLLVVLLLSEPFLAQESQQAAVLPFRLRVPTVGAAAQAGSAGVTRSFMNQSNLLIMLLFFVLQGLLYTACVVKLAEIRRQRVAPRMKLKLLENEEHLFDAGLYLGFLGTIVSFIIYSMYAHHQFSLMVAYSSTSFGILFVSFFKIFHLRPLRRKLLLEAEVKPLESLSPAAAPTLASP